MLSSLASTVDVTDTVFLSDFVEALLSNVQPSAALSAGLTSSTVYS